MKAPFLFRQAHARPLAVFTGCFVLGMMLEKALRLPPVATATALAAVAILAALLRKRGRRALAVALIAAGLLAGMARLSLAQMGVRTVETQYSVEMEGFIASEPYVNPDTQRHIFRFHLSRVDGKPSNLKLRLYLRGEDGAALDAVDYGQTVRLTGHIWKPDPVTNPYEFDFGAYLARQGLSGYATARIEDVETLGARRDLQSLVIDARRAVGSRIDALFPRSAGMVRALVLGDRTLLGEELRESLNRTGTAHLISISGLHVTVLAAFIAFLLRRFMSRSRANLLAAALLIPYGALIGFTAPFVRALAMFAILCFAPVAGYPSDGITRLCAALLGYLLIKPLSIDDAGFALSFSASAGILLLLPVFTRLTGLDGLRSRRPSAKPLARIGRAAALYFPMLLCASLAAQLATLPLVIAFFGAQSLVSLPFNLICVPLCMAGYILALFALGLSAVALPLAALVAKLPDALLALLVSVTGFSARLPAASLRVGRYPMLLTLLHWGIVLAASELSAVRFPRRRWLPLAILFVAGLSSLLAFARAWSFSIVFLDAGQADSAIVRTRGHTYMIDAGDTYTPAADFLGATCLKLDAVFLSHPHQDHAGGLTDVLESFRPDAIYVPRGWFEAEGVSPAVTEGIDRARGMGVQIVELSAGNAVRLSADAELTVYSPGAEGDISEINDMSMLALVSCQGQRALFTGDLSVKGEPEFVPDADILKVAHHGSDKASSERFLAACSPALAVISVGENNFGHPSDETLRKLEDAGARVLTTRERGAITLTWRGGGWHTETYLEASDELE